MSAPPEQLRPVLAEVSEPSVVRRPVPVWLFVVLLMLIYWGMVYFDQHSGWFSQEIYQPYRNAEELAEFQPAVSNTLESQGYKVYNRPTCVACHQLDGKGTPGQFPPLVQSEWVKETEPGRLIRIVLNGLTGPITVQGKNFQADMVPWKESLNDQEIAAVLSYIRQNKDFGNNAAEVKPEQVTAIRDKEKSRNTPFTADELLKINPAE
jgi:mono/diheme cytochrome c family protein